jgi:hypothetical protein
MDRGSRKQWWARKRLFRQAILDLLAEGPKTTRALAEDLYERYGGGSPWMEATLKLCKDLERAGEIQRGLIDHKVEWRLPQEEL